MVLLVTPSPSSYSSSSLSSTKNASRRDAASAAADVPCKLMDRMPAPPAPISGGAVAAVAPSANNTVKKSFDPAGATAIAPSDNNNSLISYRQQQQQQQEQPPQLEQSHLDEFGAEMDSEDDDCSDSSSTYSDGSSSFDTSSVLSLMNESDSLNERRRAMLDLSISKIQTINASNVSVSLRKSLLIYKTMKSLQRDLDACGVYLYDSLTERGNGVAANDVEMLEENDEVEEGDWEQRVSDLDNNPNNSDMYSLCNQRLGYGWTWGGTSEFPTNPNNDTMQDSEKCAVRGEMVSMTGREDLYSSGNNIWSGANPADSSSGYIDDYLGMWGAWEDENYNPLNNCNLTQAEIMNMFRLPAAYHLNSHQLVSQA